MIMQTVRNVSRIVETRQRGMSQVDIEKRRRDLTPSLLHLDITLGTARERICKPSANGRLTANRAPICGYDFTKEFGRSGEI